MNRFMKKRSLISDIMPEILIFGIAMLFLVFGPVLSFGFAYLGGMILNLFVGDLLVNGLNLLFNTTRFTKDFIPLACATLSVIGGYLNSSSKTKKE